MLGTVFGAVKALRHIGKVAPIVKKGASLVPVIKQAFDNKQPNPVPADRAEIAVVGVANLVNSFREAKKDGVVTKEEVVELAAKAVVVVLNTFFDVKLRLEA